jgi:hypothetical protein
MTGVGVPAKAPHLWDCDVARDTSVTPDHINATKTYVMWREKHFWNVSVLQKVYIFFLVVSFV